MSYNGSTRVSERRHPTGRPDSAHLVNAWSTRRDRWLPRPNAATRYHHSAAAVGAKRREAQLVSARSDLEGSGLREEKDTLHAKTPGERYAGDHHRWKKPWEHDKGLPFPSEGDGSGEADNG